MPGRLRAELGGLRGRALWIVFGCLVCQLGLGLKASIEGMTSAEAVAFLSNPTRPNALNPAASYCFHSDPVDPLLNPITGPKGRVPTNLSGGLKARGNPVGATGVYQAVEIAQQLRRDAGDNQIENARIGLALNLGGLGGTAVAHVLERVE